MVGVKYWRAPASGNRSRPSQPRKAGYAVDRAPKPATLAPRPDIIGQAVSGGQAFHDRNGAWHGLVQSGEAILPRWWRTVDRITITCIFALFAIGILLGFAASPPLALRNGHEPFYYVSRQAFFGSLALAVMLITSMLSPTLIRRLATIGFGLAFAALALLPVFGTDFGTGGVRWYSLGFASVQPSEFLKPVFVIVVAWLMAANQELAGPPGKLISFLPDNRGCGPPGHPTRFRPIRADPLCLVGDLLRRRCAHADRCRRGPGDPGRRHRRLQPIRAFRPPDRRLSHHRA